MPSEVYGRCIELMGRDRVRGSIAITTKYKSPKEALDANKPRNELAVGERGTYGLLMINMSNPLMSRADVYYRYKDKWTKSILSVA